MISALGPCLTMNDTTGSSNIWSNITSGTLFTDTTFTTMKSIQMFEDDGANYSFVANECVDNTTTTDVTGRWCSNVDFNTGSLILDVFPDRSAQLTYYRQSDKNSLVQLVTTCPASGYPLLFDNNGFVFSVSEVVYGWDPCLPRSTDKATFTPPVQSITSSASLGTITMVSADNVLLQLSKSVCGFDLPIKPADVVMCPELPGVAASASVNEVCIAGLCRPMKSVEWAPEAVASGGSSWLTGSAAVGTEILLESLAKPSNVDGGTITACYPQCFIDTSNCSQAAFFVSHILMCYVDRGEKVSAAELLIATFVNNSCSNASLLASISMMMEVNLFGGLSTVQPQCTHGGVALTRLYLNGSASIVLATSYGVTTYNTTQLDSDGEAVPGTVNNVAGLNARCTSCVSLWLQRLYPSPLILIAVNAVINVLLVFLANYFIQPLIGPRLVKLQALLSSILGSLSERDAEANEKWMLKCLKPYMATPLEIELHVDKVCSVVNAQRSTRNVVARNEEGETSDVVEVQRTTSESESNEIEDAPTAPPTNSSIAADEAEQETPNALLLDADTVFRSILVEKIMGGRMLACASEASIARLVELRNCCELEQGVEPIPPKRSFRFPIGKKNDVDLVVTQEDETAQNLLEINNDEVELLEDVDDDDDETSKAFSQSQQSLDDMITAVVTDTTIEWQPYVFAEEWLDNEFLLTKDWMLALNAIMLLALMGKAAFVVDTSPTLIGSWEGYTEFYFLLLSGSTPVALLINAMIRVNYSKSFSASAVTNNRLALLYTALTDPFLMIPFMCILPALVTHIIPGLLIFPFLPVVGIALVAITMKIRTKLPNAVDLRGKLLMTRSFTTIGCIATRVMFRQVVMFVCFAGVQFAFSYMMMFYAARNGTLTVSSGSWWGIVEADFDARSTVCVLEQLKESVETSWNLVYAQFV
ncbi:transmembrane protein, putative [Bodo saltans]|uniref:Transmembrane protein, putative n=1 Tax=Bodo saltans TaxID=75058 RepID=A0A0S4JF85_BODSA|nr:transmembrane protein, putative [Bodo saltans]|eukprot:CUG88784.1 transmembrane protein, putative [Bodo saltans]